MVYLVISLYNISDGHGGFEVNDARDTGLEVELESPTRKNVVQALKGVDMLAKSVQLRWVEIDEEDNGSIFIKTKRSGKFLYELRPR
jgi:hypothetical protein